MILTGYDLAQCGLAPVPVNKYTQADESIKIERLCKETGLTYASVKNYLRTMTDDEIRQKGKNKKKKVGGSILFKGESYTYQEFADLTGISKSRVGPLIRHGLTPERVVSEHHKYSINRGKVEGLRKEYR